MKKSCSASVDFEAVNRTALLYLPELLAKWLPNGQRRGPQYFARNPRGADKRAGCLSINIHTAYWADFAVGARGGDVVSLAAYLFGVGRVDAAHHLADLLDVRDED